MGSPLAAIVREFFLFTVLGCVLTQETVTLFSLGDGVFIVNGQITPLGPFPNNAPPYLGYALLGDRLSLQIHPPIPLETLDTLLIGCDGVMDLIELADHSLLGQSNSVGSIAQFWQEDRYFENPDMLRRRLALINREITRPIWTEHRMIKTVGLLPDDTSLIVIRRKRYPH
jgi:hypothetical protein